MTVTYYAWTCKNLGSVSSCPDHFFFWIFDFSGSTTSRAPRMHLRYEKSSTVPSVRIIKKHRLSVNLGCHPTCECRRKMHGQPLARRELYYNIVHLTGKDIGETSKMYGSTSFQEPVWIN